MSRANRRNTKPARPHNEQSPAEPRQNDGAAPRLLSMFPTPLPPAIGLAIEQQVRAISCLASKTARDIVNIGQTLEFVREQVGRERFQSWLRQEFPQSSAVASNYMRAARQFGEVE